MKPADVKEGDVIKVRFNGEYSPTKWKNISETNVAKVIPATPNTHTLIYDEDEKLICTSDSRMQIKLIKRK